MKARRCSKFCMLAVVLVVWFAVPCFAAKPEQGGMPPEGDEIYQRRDPFRKPEMAMERVQPKSELERMPLESFTLMGITKGLDRVVAMVRDQNGKTWFLEEGVKIGTRGGVIQKISGTQIEIKEVTQNALGQEEIAVVSIALPEGKRNPLLKSSDIQ
jgi:Tfp pilus assembly protein PilP